MITVVDIDLGMASMERRLMRLDGAKVEAGLLESSGENAQIGAWQELGTKDIRARPWASVAADTRQEQILADSGRAVGAVADGAQPKAALAAVGTITANAMKDTITSQQVGGPPLAKSTVEAKRSSVKLIDSGQMVRAIDSEVTI